MSDHDTDKKTIELMTDDQHMSDDEETVWLLSYADLMTLLFTFFVMLYSTALLNQQENLRKSLAAYLTNEAGFFKQGNSSNAMQSEQSSLGTTAGIDQALKKSIEKKLKEESILSDSQLLQTAEGIEVTFSTQILFDSGSEKIREGSLQALKAIGKTILEQNKDSLIRVEGHTDSMPIKSSRFQSNWELSGARAAALISLFEQMGYPQKNLVAVGYGASKPLFDNQNSDGLWNESNMQKNRRVVMTIIQKQAK